MAGYVGFKRETVWGTPVTPDIFIPVLSSNITFDPGFMRSAGIRSGRRTRNPGKTGALIAGGSVEMELPNASLAALLTLCFGTVNTTGSGPYTHTLSPGAQTGTTKSATIQTVVTDTSGTDRPFTAYGAKIGSFTVGATVGEYARLSFDWTGRNITLHRSVTDGATTNTDATLTSVTGAFTAADVGRPISGAGIPAGTTIASINSSTSIELSANATATATGVTVTIGIGAATASYSSIDPFTFVQSSVSVNGSTVASARSMSLTVNKGLKVDRHVLGSNLIREQVEQDHWEITSEIQADFESNVSMQLFLAATQVACVHTFSNGTDSLTITTSGQVVGDPPSLTNIGFEEQTIRLDHSHASSDASAVTAVLINGESSAS